MPQTMLNYWYGRHDEVCKGISGEQVRGVSNIDSLNVREAILTPQKNRDAVIVLGVFQKTAYLHVPETAIGQLEAASQETVRAYTGMRDPYPEAFISLIYHHKRTNPEELRRSLPADPLYRIKMLDHETLPRFGQKEILRNKNLATYGQFISGARRADANDDATRQLRVLNHGQEQYGLTRTEALQRLVLEQSMQTLGEQYKKACHSLQHFFASLVSIYETEQELIQREHEEALAKAKAAEEATKAAVNNRRTAPTVQT